MYVRLPGGRLAPGGYVVPCDVQKAVREPRDGRVTGAYVRLSSEDGTLSWVQYVRFDDLVSDAEAESGDV
jgi:hypothetical protein